MRIFLEVAVTGSESQRELLMPTLIGFGAQGFQETDTELIAYFDITGSLEPERDRLMADLQTQLRIISSNAAIRFNTLQEENWNAQWEQSLQPVEVGRRLVVKPSWTAYDNHDHRIVIQIDPKMSFGTGYHETTRLVLGLLESHAANATSLLDVGTGTGVLAIAAVLLGVPSAVGIDIDPWSINNALENVGANGVGGRVRISEETCSDFPDGVFDLITANLTLNTNLDLLAEFRRIASPSGIVLFSGLLRHDEGQMLDGLGSAGMECLERVYENEWVALVAGNRA